MTSVFLESFLRDVRKIRDARIADDVARAIDTAERAQSPQDIAQFKWLAGHRGYGRIRVGDLRLGVIVRGDVMTFVRCLRRREVYRYFP
jgi:mRNA interferase RelE/StbE